MYGFCTFWIHSIMLIDYEAAARLATPLPTWCVANVKKHCLGREHVFFVFFSISFLIFILISLNWKTSKPWNSTFSWARLGLHGLIFHHWRHKAAKCSQDMTTSALFLSVRKRQNALLQTILQIWPNLQISPERRPHCPLRPRLKLAPPWSLPTHTPLINGVEVHPLNLGVGCPKHLVLQCFSSTALIKGMKRHSPQLRGMGCQGREPPEAPLDTRMAWYEKYRCWAPKDRVLAGGLQSFGPIYLGT